MRTLLIQIFFREWPRKLVSFVLALLIWSAVSRMMTTTKVLSNIPVKVLNLPPEKTIEGMQVNGLLNKRVTLTLSGMRAGLAELSAKDLQVVIDAKDQPTEWIANIDKGNLVCLNSDYNLSKIVSKVACEKMVVKQRNLVTEKIPVTVAHPIGEVPRGYQFLDVWPYQLYVTVTGPEDTVKKLKQRGLRLTFNLSDISRAELDTMQMEQQSDEINFMVPDSWKKIALPYLSDTPVDIDDPKAASLRIHFSRQEMLPIGFSLPVSVYYPPKHGHAVNPDSHKLATNEFIAKRHGLKVFNAPLYAQGVSRLFLETVKDMAEIVIIAAPKSERANLLWNVQFMYPHELENRYVARVLSEASEDLADIQPHLQEEYLRNRFRSYMNRFRLYTPQNNKLALKAELQGSSITVTPQNYDIAR